MNDRFKFKVWDSVQKDWSDKTFLIGSDGILYEEDIGTHAMGENMVVVKCTGLKDKKGNLIFEGDILKDKESIGVVKFGEYTVNDMEGGGEQEVLGWYLDAKVNLSYNAGTTYNSIISLNRDIKHYYEIAGDKYSNPELKC